MTNHAPGGGMTADELAEFRAMLTQHREDHAGCHVHCDGFGCHEVIRLMETLSAALQRAEDAEGVMGKALQALDDLCVLHHRDVCGDEAFREASKRVTEKGGTLAVWADTAEMLRAALAAAGEGGGTKA
jgi:hypothetical protein